jgi:tetratricopeptide (TPR) repeat protein
MDTATSFDIRSGIDLYLKQDYPGAEVALSEAVQRQPTWAEGLSYLGFAQYMQQKYSEAASHLEKAVLLEPENAEARFGLGLVWAAMGKVDPAIACWDETLRVKPDHAGAKQSLVGGLIHRAQKYLDDKDYDRAEHDLDRAIKIDKKSPQAVCMLANHFEAQGFLPRAEKVIAEALGHMPDDPHIQAFAAKLGVTASKAAVSQAQQANARAAVQQSQQVPCPACKRMVMEWTVICPHCTSQIKAMPGTFAGRADALPVVAWQDVMYYIMSVIWILMGAAPILAIGFTAGFDMAFSGISAFITTISLAQVLIGIGLLFQNDFAMTFAKWLCIIGILGDILAFMMHIYMKHGAILAVIDVVAASISGFLIYLLNYQGCD